MKIFITTICILLFHYSIIAQTSEQPNSANHQIVEKSKIDIPKATAAINNYLDHLEQIGDPFNGQILIYDSDRELYNETRGYANLQFKAPAKRSTSYNLASISKMLTALVILRMNEEGLVDIYSPIGKYIDELTKTDVGATTIYELLTHSSGLPETYEQYLWEFVHVEKHNYDRDSLLGHLQNVTIKDEDKGKTEYTNLGAVLTSIALENITGQPYQTLLKKYLIDPLGLDNTGLAIINDQSVIIENKAVTYEYYYGEYYEFPFAKVGLLGAAAGLHSSSDDLQRILNAVFVNKNFISSSSYQILTTPYKAGSEYSFGCFDMQFKIEEDETINVIGHEGFIWGVSTAALYLPEDQIRFILLSNRGFSANLEEGIRKIVKLMYGGEVVLPKMKLDNNIMEIEEETNFINYVNDLGDLETLKKKYQVREYDINEMGYVLIGKGQYRKAEAVLKLNCRFFPKSSNAYDSLGEAQYLLKDYDNALTNYKRSLELDRTNENAEEYISAIEEIR